VADRPLRPATDRRLGRPLPHQLPNRTQAAPKAPHGFLPQQMCGISPSFPGLSPTSGYVPTRYSPVRHCQKNCSQWPCDLHVLSIPPAFALSQDQTLRFINPCPTAPLAGHRRTQAIHKLSLQNHHHPPDPTQKMPQRNASNTRQHPPIGTKPKGSAAHASHPKPAYQPQHRNHRHHSKTPAQRRTQP
jgi:hypothetical protein